MAITSQLFDAYLKCSSKCWFQSLGEEGAENLYSDWVRMRSDGYRADGIERLLDGVANLDRASAPAKTANRKTVKWKVAANFPARKENLESIIDIVERAPSESRGKPAQFTPIRFIFTNKLSKDDKLLLAYDAFVLSETLGRDVIHGKIIHGDNYTTVKVRTLPLAGTVRKLTGKIATLLASDSPPELILNRHCGECEYQVRCRQKAIDKDDLSLLAGMSEKERKKLNSKGIFTITQLSYTFRPRRHPKRLRDKREKYHHSLKALAIREKKIHIVGSPELKIEGTPVYWDVEGLPDRDFYYLIGLRFRNGESVEQHSLWADSQEDEARIWREFLTLLDGIDHPVLICYGSYETVFIKKMCGSYGGPSQGSMTENTICSVINLLSVIYGRVYFPAPSNGLKEIARYCGYRWSEEDASGLKSIVWREMWEKSGVWTEQEKMIQYNAQDCAALDMVTKKVLNLQTHQQSNDLITENDIVDVDKLKRENPFIFNKNEFYLPEFGMINKAAYWDYQRERVYLKSSKVLKSLNRKKLKSNKSIEPNKVVDCEPPRACPKCSSTKLYPHGKSTKKVIDLKFTSHGIKRWITLYRYKRYICQICKATFYSHDELFDDCKYGPVIMAYSIYLCIDLRLPIKSVDKSINKVFGLNLANGTTNRFKSLVSISYKETYDSIIDNLCKGTMLHADETRMSVNERDCFVWVFASMEEVAYFYTETRDGEYVQSLLRNFNGVLVSDFYAIYDGIDCPQQKCLIHLIRDINEALYKHPYDEALKRVADNFTKLLRPMIETVDRFGLKHHFLKKHLPAVDRFYEELFHLDLTTEAAIKIRERLEKNRDKLFTFLRYDGVPWNNNNAEHAIKPFAMLRNIIKGVTTEKGLREYLILLSVCETCKYKGIDFLDFLRSGEKDIDAFAASRRRRCVKNDAKHQPHPLPNESVLVLE